MKTEYVSCPLCKENEYSIISKGYDYELDSSDNEFQIVKCTNCGLIRLNPRPTQSELKIIYPENYSCYQIDTYFNPFLNIIRIVLQKRFIRQIKKYVDKDVSILDVGCGSGELLSLLKEHGDKNWYLAGNDINIGSKECLNINGIDFLPGRFEDIDYKIGTWKVIIMQGVIEHLSDVDSTLDSIYTMLSEDGILIIVTPNTNCWDRKIFEKKYWGQWHFPRHWTLYNQNLIKQHLQEHGIKVIKNTPMLSPWSWIRSLENRFADRKSSKIVRKFFTMNNVLLIVFFTLINFFQIIFSQSSANMFIVAKKQRNEKNHEDHQD